MFSPLVGAALRRSSVARAAKDRGLAQLAPRCAQDPRLDSEEGHPRDREGERQCLKLDIWTNAIFCYRLCGRRASSTCGCRTTVCWRTFSSTRTHSSRTSTSGPWDSTCSPCTANSLSPSRKMWRGRLQLFDRVFQSRQSPVGRTAPPVGRLARIPPSLWFIHLLHVLLAVNLICASCMHPSRCTPRQYST